MPKNLTTELNSKLSELGLEPIKDVDNCPERTAYLQHITNPDWGDKDWVKKLNQLKKNYLIAFHKFVAEQMPYLLHERGEEKVYWMYQEETGVYEEINHVVAREYVMRLMSAEGLEDAMTTTYVSNCLARYRAYTPERSATHDDFDNDADWFHAKNGWVNVVNHVFEPHTPERLSLRVSNVDYDAKATCPVYDKFLDEDIEIPKDAVRVMDQFSGLLLVPDVRYQKMLTLIGRPGSGKSTLLDIWEYVLGDMATQKRLTELSGESFRFAGSDLVNRTLCWFDEVDVKRSEMSNTLGTLITGKTLRLERKGINGIKNTKNKLKCVLTANSLPMSSEHGMYRRLILINFNHSFSNEGTKDIYISDKLEREASGILNRMLTGLADLRKMREFTMIAGHDDLIEEYKESSDIIAEFLVTYFEPTLDEEEMVESSEICAGYNEFAKKHGGMIMTPRRFGKLLGAQPLNQFVNIEPHKGTKGVRFWKGLKLKTEYKFEHNMGYVSKTSLDF